MAYHQWQEEGNEETRIYNQRVKIEAKSKVALAKYQKFEDFHTRLGMAEGEK